MVPIRRIFGDFLRRAFPASRVQHISDLHSKFALSPYYKKDKELLEKSSTKIYENDKGYER